MQLINTLSLTPDVNDWLASSRWPRILHVFDSACNLINERGDVLSIVTLQIGNGPFNLVIDDDVLFFLEFSLQSLISNFPNHLNLKDSNINTGDAKFWSPHPDWGKLHTKKGEILDQLASLPITNYLEHSGFDTPLDNHSGPLNHQYLQITNYFFSNSPLAKSLVFALVNADLPGSIAAAQKLAGLGVGLTPAGDDFILGAILAAWIIHPCDVASVLAKEVTNTAAPLTTSLSAAWLRSVGKGEAGILWHDFFDALITRDASDIQLKMTKLLSVGETSGADAMSGFLGATTYFKEHIINPCPS